MPFDFAPLRLDAALELFADAAGFVDLAAGFFDLDEELVPLLLPDFAALDRADELAVLLLLEDDAADFEPALAVLDLAADPLFAEPDFDFDVADPVLPRAADGFVLEADDFDPLALDADVFAEPDFDVEDFLVAMIFLRKIE